MQQLSPLSADVTPAFELQQSKELEFYQRLHKEKYRDKDQPRIAHSHTLANNLSSTPEHYTRLKEMFYSNRFLPAGRVQAAMGATEREVSPFNCSVSQRIDDSMDSIMAALANAAKILRLGTGVGYNFSHLRPHGALIEKLQTKSSGPLSFMKIYDAMARTIASAGHRRGAQMGIMNVDHPDIEKFIDAKMEAGAYRQFNLSVGITEGFMRCVRDNSPWRLSFDGQTYAEVSAVALWNKILRNAYESAEPGIVFLDRMNETNNLYYCEHIEATNPCSEQPLPAYGLCTLGSFNLIAYIYKKNDDYNFNTPLYIQDIRDIVEAYDNLFDRSIYAIPEHKQDALNKRRIGLGLTGIANACELMVGEASYGSEQFCRYFDYAARTLTQVAYGKSIELAKERGPFPLFDPVKYPSSKFIQTLPENLIKDIELHGIRNSHLISYAPCGTISQCAGNISSGVEPVFYHEMTRDVHMKDGQEKVTFKDFAYREFGFAGKTLEDCSVNDHLAVAEIAQRYCDSAVSKTVNVAETCSYEDYSNIYMRAYEMGLKGITVFKPGGIRGAVITKAKEEIKDPCAGGVCER